MCLPPGGLTVCVPHGERVPGPGVNPSCPSTQKDGYQRKGPTRGICATCANGTQVTVVGYTKTRL